MAEANITSNGTGGGNFTAGATWDGGVAPEPEQHAIIASGDNVTLNGNDEVASLTINSSGTFTGGAYTLTINDEGNATYGTDNFALKNLGTFTHANCTILLTLASTGGSHVYIEGFTSSHPLYNLTLNNSHATSVVYQVGAIEIAGDFTLTDGIYRTNGAGDFDVTGDVSIASGATFYGHNDAISHGSLTIADGGTYSASSGTTTITSESDPAGYTLQNSGTFTHNNGLVKINAGGMTTQADNGPYYDFQQAHASTDFYTQAAFTIYNNLDIVGDFDHGNNAYHLTVYGNMTIGDGSTTTRYCLGTTATNNLTVHGTLEITNGATADLGTHGTVNVGGIRNTGGSIL